jgi:23S rRNA (adenine2503-C2)-methyltransferase
MDTASPSRLPVVPGDDRPDLRSLSRADLAALLARLGERPFRAGQLFKWLHQRGAASLDEMTDLPKALRERLAAETRLTVLAVDRLQRSSDGTIKFRFRTADGKLIESVYMPDPEKGRRTLCVSTQVGCAMHCAFCATGTMGLTRHLAPGEIADQVHRVNRFLVEEGLGEGPRPLTNLVYMGMGEPLHNFEGVKASLDILLSEEGPNFSHRHVTVSTSGLVPMMERLGKETEVKLAVSLNATTDEVRDRIMPVNRKWNLEALLEACRKFPMKQGRRITFEYVLFAGINDSDEDLERLAALVRRVPAKVNLIQYNRNEGLPFEPASEERVAFFVDGLMARGIQAMARKNRGRDISAACGQLVAKAGGPGQA